MSPSIGIADFSVRNSEQVLFGASRSGPQFHNLHESK